jgi:hypothetical protein
MPGKIMGSCLDPGLPGTGPQRGEKEGTDLGPGPPSVGEKSQLEPDRDGGDMMRNKEEPHWGRDAGGSVTNRVRRLPVQSYNIVNK